MPIYDYAHSDFTTVLEAIWSKAYNNVANANNIIQNIQYADEDMFESKAREKAMIEGEAYALRAFIHFDLLRMFAPAPTKNDQGTYIPYIMEYPSIRAPKLSVDSCCLLYTSSHAGNISFCHFQVAGSFGTGSEHGSHLTAHSFAQVFELSLIHI